MKARYSNLLAGFGNACGPAFFDKAPRLKKALFGWVYIGACSEHDFYYYAGGGVLDRLWADFNFLYRMLVSARGSKLLPLLWLVAVFFFVVVLLFGWMRFSYSNRYYTLEEIVAAESLDRQRNSGRIVEKGNLSTRLYDAFIVWSVFFVFAYAQIYTLGELLHG